MKISLTKILVVVLFFTVWGNILAQTSKDSTNTDTTKISKTID